MPFDGKELPQVAQDLLATRSFLEKGWCKNALARNAAGWSCRTSAPQATQWCVNGALEAAVRSDWGRFCKAHSLLKSIHSQPHAFNNKQTSVEPVLEFVDQAIALAMEKV